MATTQAIAAQLASAIDRLLPRSVVETSPARPPGATATTHTKNSPRYATHARDTLATATLKNVSNAAPMTGPKNVDVPPITVAISTLPERASPTPSADASSRSSSPSAPATPAKNADAITIVKRT